MPFSLHGNQGDPADPGRVHVVDEDDGLRGTLRRLLAGHGYHVRVHASAEDFLQAHDPHALGCILLEVSLPGLDGLALQRRLAGTGITLPFVFLTARAEVACCAAAMREGAVDFLTKPVDEEALLRAVRLALLRSIDRRCALQRQSILQERLALLTPREHEVLLYVMNGRLNRQAAVDLGTSEKTIKVHRMRALEKLGVRSVAEAVRMFELARPRTSPSD
jgi:FixJ family two-component response regulator